MYLAYNAVKLFIQCATGASVFVTVCIATMMFCIPREWMFGMVATGTFLSPGFLLMGAIYRKAGGVLRDTMFAYFAALVPGALIDVAIYTTVFFGLIKLARMLALKRAVTFQPTTDDEPSETAL